MKMSDEEKIEWNTAETFAVNVTRAAGMRLRNNKNNPIEEDIEQFWNACGYDVLVGNEYIKAKKVLEHATIMLDKIIEQELGEKELGL